MVASKPVLYRSRKVLAVLVLAANGLLLLLIVPAISSGHVSALTKNQQLLLAMLVVAALPVSAVNLAIGGLGWVARIAGIVSVVIQGGGLLMAHSIVNGSSNQMESGLAAFGMMLACCTPLAILLNFAGATATLSIGHRKASDFCRCLQCGYNLTGNVSGICPECGAPVDRPGKPASTSR